MIITARPFITAAQRLAQYRAATDTFRTVIATVEDIYNCYNYGRKNPEAIRNYVSDAWHSWPAPAPRFLLILGDASWDPKFHLANAVNVDYIPTAGNPANDNYYVVADTLLPCMPQLSVGRIPAQTLQEANSVIDKIISYESAGPQAWNRSFLFAIGGKTTYERDTLFKPGVDGTIRRWIEPNCLEAKRIIKSKLDIVSYNDLDTLITEMNRGTLWFQFVGHGGTRIIDMGVERPDIFATRDRYPFFVTLSCNTAHFAEPYETGLNEKFVMASENGSIASYGTSGLGVVSYDEMLRDNMFSSLFGESVGTYGEISTSAKRKLLNDFGSGNQFVANTANQYIVLGDPATHIPLPRSPELAVASLDIVTDPDILTESKAARIDAEIHNYGTCLIDSVDVVLSVRQGATVLMRNRRRIASFVESTTESWQYDFPRVSGSVRITVEIDPDCLIKEPVRSNNTASLDREVLPRGIVQVFPLDCAVIPADSSHIRFTVANPSYVPDASLNPSVEFQISADPLFAAIAHSQSAAVERVYTSIDVLVPQTYPEIWYWRARLVTSQGAEEWSERRSMSFGGPGNNERWYQRKRSQFEYDTRNALEFSGDTAVVPGLRNAFIEVVSAGNNQIEIEDFAEIWVDGVNVSPNHRGFNIAVIDPERGRVVDTVSYDTYADRSLAAGMAQYLRDVPAGRYVAIAIRDDANGTPEYTVGGTNITQELRDAIRLFGAQFVDSIGYRDSYALLARKSEPSTAREMYRSYGPAFFKDTLQIGSDHRTIRSTVIGPASQWKTFRWDGRPGGQGSSVRLNIYRSGSSADSLIWSSAAILPGAYIALALPSNVPLIKAELVSDDSTAAGGFMLNGWQFEYVSRFPEFGVTSQTVQALADSIEQGSRQNLAISVRAVGYGEVTSARVRVRAENTQGASWQSDETIHLPVTGETSMVVQVPTTDMPGENTYVVTVDPEQIVTEYYRGNNIFSGRYHVKHDTQVPVLNVLIDGEIPADDDIISPTPVIKISLRDASPLPVKDTSAVQVTMDGRRLWLIGNPQVEYTAIENEEEKVRIIYRPALAKGYHTLTADAKDASGNPADSIPYQVRVLVKLDNGIEQFYPFPNPSGGPLDFTFTLTGADVPDEIRVKIYTVAGRLVRDIKTMKDQLRIGFNRIRWNGRDEDDNMLGNGVYFYKVSVVRGGASDEQTGKLSILR
jgi:flagellar hook assembly protein FlgD